MKNTPAFLLDPKKAAAARHRPTFLLDRRASPLIEWMIVTLILVSLVGGALWQILLRLQARYIDVYHAL